MITDLLPTHHLTVHQSAIRALGWIKAPPCLPSGDSLVDQDPTVIASGGYDGMECLTDIRDGHGVVINRTRGFFMSFQNTDRLSNLMYSRPFRRCQFFGLLSLHRRTNNHGSWEYRQGVFCLTEHAWKRSFVGGTPRSCLGAFASHGSPFTYRNAADIFLQCVHASDFHPQLAVGATDGTCSTTNSLSRGTVVCIT